MNIVYVACRTTTGSWHAVITVTSGITERVLWSPREMLNVWTNIGVLRVV